MSALAAVQSQDTAHHMHSLLLSHGNEWNISFGRVQGAPMVKHGRRALIFPMLLAGDSQTTHKDACFGCSAIKGDTAHHMHSLLLSHGNELNMSFGRDQGAAMVKYECFGCSAITGHCSPHAFLAALTWQ